MLHGYVQTMARPDHPRPNFDLKADGPTEFSTAKGDLVPTYKDDATSLKPW